MPDKKTDNHPSVAPAGTKVITIPGVKLSVSIGKDVVVRQPDAEHSYKGRVVGYNPYEYIIVSVRLPGKIREELVSGGPIILKYIHRGTVYGFKTFALTTVSSPALLIIEYPRAIEKIELRRETRQEVNLDAVLHGNEGESECLVINMSTTGCKISARAGTKDPLYSIKKDETMVISLSLGHEGALKLPIVARNIKRERGIITIGAMFLDIFKKEEDIIAKYLERVRRLTR